MKRSILLILFVIFISRVFGRDTILEDSSHRSSQPIPRTEVMLAEIMSVVGLKTNFQLKEAKVPNIEASISHRKRYILYNPDYINWINSITGNKWAATALLAHEVGHHLNGHTIRRGGSRPPLELEADEFAGFVLFRLGATLEEAQEVMKYIARTKASKTHPGKEARLLAIQKGWSKASNKESLMAASGQ